MRTIDYPPRTPVPRGGAGANVRLSSAPARPGCVRVRASSQAAPGRAPRRPPRMRATASPRSTRPWRAPLVCDLPWDVPLRGARRWKVHQHRRHRII